MLPPPWSFLFLHPSVQARLYVSFHLSLVITKRTTPGILSRNCIVFKESLEALEEQVPDTNPPLNGHHSERKKVKGNHGPQCWLVSEFPLGVFPVFDMLGINQEGDVLYQSTPGQYLLETFAFRKSSWLPKTLLDLKEDSNNGNISRNLTKKGRYFKTKDYYWEFLPRHSLTYPILIF